VCISYVDEYQEQVRPPVKKSLQIPEFTKIHNCLGSGLVVLIRFCIDRIHNTVNLIQYEEIHTVFSTVELTETPMRRKIRLTEGKENCRHIKKFMCLRPPPLPCFCLGWCGKFEGSESGQNAECKTPAEYAWSLTEPHRPIPPPPSHLFTEGGGVGES